MESVLSFVPDYKLRELIASDRIKELIQSQGEDIETTCACGKEIGIYYSPCHDCTAEDLHRTVIEVEVLSDQAYSCTDLEQIANDVIYGGCSGSSKIVSSQKMTREEAAKALLKQGSDPNFLLGAEER